MAKEINTLEYFRDAEGNEPFTEWIKNLKDVKAAYTIAGRLARLRMGNLGNCRDLASGVWEMKIDFGPGYRVYFARSGRTIYLILGGGDKGTQKIDIKLAKKNWAEYKKRAPQQRF